MTKDFIKAVKRYSKALAMYFSGSDLSVDLAKEVEEAEALLDSFGAEKEEEIRPMPPEEKEMLRNLDSS